MGPWFMEVLDHPEDGPYWWVTDVALKLDEIDLLGDNRWIEMETWPPTGVRVQPLYFREGVGESSASLNNGRLAFERPQGAERPRCYPYDPEDPIPSLAGVIDALPIFARAGSQSRTPVHCITVSLSGGVPWPLAGVAWGGETAFERGAP
jgi:predicted acyl esterase